MKISVDTTSLMHCATQLKIHHIVVHPKHFLGLEISGSEAKKIAKKYKKYTFIHNLEIIYYKHD